MQGAGAATEKARDISMAAMNRHDSSGYIRTTIPPLPTARLGSKCYSEQVSCFPNCIGHSYHEVEEIPTTDGFHPPTW